MTAKLDLEGAENKYQSFKVSGTVLFHKSRPCGFGQSLGRPIVRSISPFFWSTKKIFVPSQGVFGQALIFLVNQISFWYTKIPL